MEIGGGYIIGANDFVDIKRHHNKDAAFKFVSLDSPDAVDFGKNGPNPDKVKGLIEARFFLEKVRPLTPSVVHHHHYHPRPRPPYYPTWSYGETPIGSDSVRLSTADGNSYSEISGSSEGSSRGRMRNRVLRSKSLSSGGAHSTVQNDYSAEACYSSNYTQQPTQQPLQDGCTVEGYSTGQNFRTIDIDLETDYVSVKLFLQGFTGPVPTVAKRETVKNRKLTDLERENEELRKQLAEVENEKLRKQLAEAEAATLGDLFKHAQ